MTDAQHLFDFARTQFNEIAADVERHFELVADQLREWIPAEALSYARPAPRRLPPPTTWQLMQRWVARHKALTTAMVAFLATGSIGAVVYKLNASGRRKRRARRSASGARTDVVVLAGSPVSPLTSALALDLERRGFIVYIVASTLEEEHHIRAQNRADLLPLHVDLVDPFAAQEQLSRFLALLGRQHFAFEGAELHRLNFAGLVLIPDTSLPESRIEEQSMEEWSDALNAKVLNTIATTQHFLPAIVEHKAKILLLTPSVTPSLRLPGHAIESTIYGALNGFISTLATELRQDAVGVSHFKLGNVDIPSVTAKQRRENKASSRVRATPLRKLHDSVFDALMTKRSPRVNHVGRGSMAYDLIGSIAPPAAISWMMGKRKQIPAIPDEPIEMRDEDLLAGSQASITWEKVGDGSDQDA